MIPAQREAVREKLKIPAVFSTENYVSRPTTQQNQLTVVVPDVSVPKTALGYLA